MILHEQYAKLRKKCEGCGTEFGHDFQRGISYFHKRRFCSAECANKYQTPYRMTPEQRAKQIAATISFWKNKPKSERQVRLQKIAAEASAKRRKQEIEELEEWKAVHCKPVKYPPEIESYRKSVQWKQPEHTFKVYGELVTDCISAVKI